MVGGISMSGKEGYRINRDFYAIATNQKLVTGISYIPTAQGLLYLSMIRDLFGRSIIS